MRRLWERMAAVYLNRWTSTMGVSPQGEDGKLTVAGDTWARVLGGLTADQLARGLEACNTSADGWPPSLPEFRAMCVGVPTIAQVRADLKADTATRQPFTRLVWMHLDAWAYRHASQDVANRMLAEAYAEARDHLLRGGELPPDPVATITHQEKPFTPADPDRVKEHLAQLRALFGKTEGQEA